MEPREIDTLIAEKVMGNSHWLREEPTPEHIPTSPCDGYGPDGECSFCTGIIARDTPHYSTDLAAAWEVVRKMRQDSYCLELQSSQTKLGIYTGVRFYHMDSMGVPVDTIEVDGYGPDDIEAQMICLAALKAVGVEVQE